jgi:lysozyme
MRENYDAELCEEKHEQIKEKLDLHDKRLNNHSDRLDRLEQNETENRTEIKNLIKKMDDFIQNICKQLEILFGVYHFAGHQDVSSEVNAFIGYISGMVFDTIHWLDIEQPPESYSWEWDKQTAVNFTNQFISLFISRTGKKIGVYTNKWLYENYLKGNIDPNTKLWIAAYGLSSNPYANTSWQYSASGFVPGVDGNVDLDLFVKDILTGAGGSTPPSPSVDKLKEQIEALQYNLNIDYYVDIEKTGLVYPELFSIINGKAK